MENVADALKMAAAVVIFIIAIGSSFSLFGTAKQTADSIIRMRDKQAYLEAAEEEVGGILYTSSSSIKGNEEGDSITEYVSGITKNGDRVVKIDDVISTIYRYSVEKYGVTIMYSTGEIIARFDSNTENIMRQYNNIEKDNNKNNSYDNYINILNDNTHTGYVNEVQFSDTKLKEIYEITVDFKISCGAPWYGNEKEIKKRINADISGDSYQYNNQEYQGKGLIEQLNRKKNN